jgi:hypothetical protein
MCHERHFNTIAHDVFCAPRCESKTMLLTSLCSLASRPGHSGVFCGCAHVAAPASTQEACVRWVNRNINSRLQSVRGLRADLAIRNHPGLGVHNLSRAECSTHRHARHDRPSISYVSYAVCLPLLLARTAIGPELSTLMSGGHGCYRWNPSRHQSHSGATSSRARVRRTQHKQ